MPCGGLTPFLLMKERDDLKEQLKGVNALWRANSISTKAAIEQAERDFNGVNALWRANSISTPPDETTHSDWGFGHHFLTYLCVLKRSQKWA